MKKIKNSSVTLPTEEGQEGVVIKLAEDWGADAIRDSDGTSLSPKIVDSGFDIYSTLCLIRADQEWAKSHPEQTPEKFLMSKPVAAERDTLVIKPMSTYCSESYALDVRKEALAYMEVINRTTGESVEEDYWEFNSAEECVTVINTRKGHLYTVSFIVRLIWDVTSRHNHITNNWTCEHVIPVDPSYSETREHLLSYFDNWLQNHSGTDVVRFTSLFYHMPNDRDNKGQRGVFGDSYGYTDTVSLPALADFEKEYAYRLKAEDFIDQGYYNSTDRVPTKQWQDWMAFTQERVEKLAIILTEKAHAAGKRTAFYYGDHWIGMEPQKQGFQDIGFDIVITVPHDETQIRRLADAPGEYVRELRMRPYFFPNELGVMDPAHNSQNIWLRLRRAILRNPVIGRLGWGGYLSLAMEYPHFIEHISELCDEFRLIKSKVQGQKPASYLKVAVISAWGKLRSWAEWTVQGERFGNNENATQTLQCLGGLPVEVEFMSFNDLKTEGIPDNVEVIINSGDAGTSWNGGELWKDQEITSTLRNWIADGGGFIGINGATSCEFQGRIFQLSDVMGVEKETGYSNHLMKCPFNKVSEHFITDDFEGKVNLGTEHSFVSLRDPNTEVLYANGQHVLMSANLYNKGRAVYIAGLPYDMQNARMLLRALLWASRKEGKVETCFSTNQFTDCITYPDAGLMAIVNHSDKPQNTIMYDKDGNQQELKLKECEIIWKSY